MSAAKAGTRGTMWDAQPQWGEQFCVADATVPNQTIGWVVVGRAKRDEPSLLAATAESLSDASLATLTVDLPRGMSAAADCVRLAVAELRRELAGDLPVAYLGAGRAAGAGWAASLGGELDGVMAWNGRAGSAWPKLGHVQTPSLLAVDHRALDLPWQLLIANVLRWRLGPTDLELAGGSSPLEAMLARWYWDRILDPAPALLIRPRGSRRRRAVALGAAAVLAGPGAAGLALPSAGAAAPLPNFHSGHRLRSALIGGDNAWTMPALHRKKRHRRRPRLSFEFSGGKRLRAAHIAGDGPNGASRFATGSIQLIDGDGVKHFVNTNITFSTSSSASGAMSEASYTHSVAASTLNGGTVQSRLNDAYDGYNTVCISNNNTVATCETANANFNIYNRNGPPTTTCTGPVSAVNRAVVFPVKTVGNLQMSRQVFVPDNDGFGRWLDIFTNTGGSPLTITPVVANNLGSDSNTVITNDSSGNTSPTVADTWVTTFQNFSGTTSSDPRLGHVLQGPNPPVSLAGINFANGDDNPFWGYTFTLQPGQTKIIMNFGVTQPSKAAAATKSAQLASQADAHELDCMTTQQKSELANFAAPQAAGDSYSTAAGKALSQAAPGVLANDQGSSGLTAGLVSGPSHAASFSLNPDGSFSYTPASGYSGPDSFTYQASYADGLASAPATVTINVTGKAPAITSASSASFTVGQAGSFTIQTGGTPTPTISESTQLPSGLTFKDNGDGTATISGTPAAGTHGSYPVSITASNGVSPSATQQLTLNVGAAAAPKVVAYKFPTQRGHVLSVPAPGLLAAVTGQGPFKAYLAGKPRHGTATVSLDGGFSYTPAAKFLGRDHFSYVAVDADGTSSAPATVSVLVTPNPVQFKQILRSANQILASYRSIMHSISTITLHLKPSKKLTQVKQLLAQAQTLANRAAKLERSARSEKNVFTALAEIAEARQAIAVARKRVAEARVIAAEIRAGWF